MCWAVVGEAVRVIVADGWNRLTLSVMGLLVTGLPLKSALSLKAKVTVSGVGSGSLAWTVRVTKMVRLAPGANGVLAANVLASMAVTNALTPGSPGCWATPLTTMLPSKVSV